MTAQPSTDMPPIPPTTPAVPEPPLPEPPAREHTDGLSVDVGGEEQVDRKLAEIEMVGEEVAAGWVPAPHQALSPEVRYLHASRTIHQLVTDRNRSVGIFLFVASVLIGASSGLMNVSPQVETIVPIQGIIYWSLPVTFGTLAVIGAFMSMILIRTRVGLIYEVAKMNALLGLPSERVKRVNPFSIFFLMYTLVVLLGAASAGFTAAMVASHNDWSRPAAIWLGVGIALIYLILFQGSYYAMILATTSEKKLQQTGR